MVSTGWRYARANQDYYHSHVNEKFDNNWKPRERLSILDVNAQYIFSPRLSVQASLPIVFNQYSQLFPPLGQGNGQRSFQNAQGIGDLSLFANYWLLKRKQHPLHNF